jgi:hypothetical protein
MVEIVAETSKEFENVLVPEDVYMARVKDEGKLVTWIDKNGQEVTSIVLPFEILDGKYSGKVVSAFATFHLTESTKLGKWFNKLGIMFREGEKIDTKVLVSRACKIIVKNGKDKKGNQGSQVSDILGITNDIEIKEVQ